MDVNEYLVAGEVARRLEEARHPAARRALGDAVEAPRSRLRSAVGHALIAAGRALLEPERPAPSPLR